MDAPSPTIGIQPYIDQAIRRIQRYFAAPHAREAFVIGVFGEWGSGKSFLLDKVGQGFAQPAPTLTSRRQTAPATTLTIRFNPWRYEREAHLLVPLLKTTRKALADAGTQQEEAEAQARNLVQQAVAHVNEATGGKPLPWLKRRLVTLGNVTVAATKFIEFKVQVPGLGEVKLDLPAAQKAIQEQIDRAAKQAEAADGGSGPPPIDFDSLYYDLHHALHEVTRGEPGEGDEAGQLNFLFLIDDIDRCLPDKAVEMLESIKLFLDVPGCAFVLALDDEVVERGIAHRYRDYLDVADRSSDSIAYALRPERYEQYLTRHAGSRLPPITGHEYLEKIVQLPFRLPRWSRDEVRDFLRAQFPELFPPEPTRPDLAPPDATPRDGLHRPERSHSRPERAWLLELFVQAVPPIPRKLIRAAELLEFTQGIVQARGLGQRLHDYTLAQLVLLQLFAPECFRFLRRDRREAWLSLARRIAQTRQAGIPRAEGSPPQAGQVAELAPGHTSASFFDWWQRCCDAEKAAQPAAGTYLERVELPFIAELRHAVRNRSGFDPRLLFLPDPELKVDERLEPYFSLFEPSARSAHATRQTVARPQRPAITPAEPSTFVALLLGPGRESWLNALGNETRLPTGVLDDATFAQLLAGLAGRSDLPNTDWLELVLPILNPQQIKRLYRETGLLPRLARQAGLLPEPTAEQGAHP